MNEKIITSHKSYGIMLSRLNGVNKFGAKESEMKGRTKLHPRLMKLLVIFAIGVLILFLVINIPALYS